MWELVKEILTSPFGSFASVFTVFGLAFWIAVKSGSVIEKYRLINKMEGAIDKIKDDMSMVKAYMELSREKNDPFSQRQSPINLNEKGRDVSDKLNSSEIINRVWEKILFNVSNNVSKTNDNNPYNIQQVCFNIGKVYSQYIDEISMDKIKTFAFSEGYNLVDFDLLFGIEIRNRYFKENDIKVAEVDKHDPTKKDKK